MSERTIKLLSTSDIGSRLATLPPDLQITETFFPFLESAGDRTVTAAEIIGVLLDATLNYIQPFYDLGSWVRQFADPIMRNFPILINCLTDEKSMADEAIALFLSSEDFTFYHSD
jgi:hypothetical protein